jgi:hypothetical protein
MPNNEKNAQQAPTEFTPTAGAAEEVATPITSVRSKRLGTGAIIGISAAGLAVIAGSFGAGAAVATVASHNDRGGFSQLGDFAQGGPQGQQGQQGQLPQGGPQGQNGQVGPNGQQGGKRGPQGAPNGTAPSGAPTAPGTKTN